MSKRKNQNNKHNQPKSQSMHKVSAKFAEHAANYFHDPDPGSTIAEIISNQDEEIPKNLILKAIEKLEDCRDQELLYAAKDGDMDAKPSKEIAQMIKLLRQSLTQKASGEAVKLNISESAAFGQFVSLKVPGGRDTYSSMRLPKLIASLGENAEQTQAQIEEAWETRNNIDKNFPYTEKELASVLRWHLRGLAIGSAIRKVRVDIEVTQNYLAAARS
jgi:hypothetical protein